MTMAAVVSKLKKVHNVPCINQKDSQLYVHQILMNVIFIEFVLMKCQRAIDTDKLSNTGRLLSVSD